MSEAVKQRFLWLYIVSVMVFTHVAAFADWPRFRGPGGMGHVPEPSNVPINWSETQNVKWKTPIPYRGWSSPVIMDGQIWLTTATLEGNDFFAICIDAETGKILFNKRLFQCAEPEPLGNDMNCYASPTPVIEMGRVYISFGSYGTACINTNTFKVLWRRTDLKCRHYRGPGSSLILIDDLLVITMDGVDVQYLITLDKRTGREVWKTDRTAEWNDLGPDGKPYREGDLRKAYTTPLIVESGGKKQMISVGARACYGYDPTDGRELWKVSYEAYSGAACPVYDDGIAYVISGFGKTELLAIRTDGVGDVTDTHVLWRNSRTIPRTPSPVLVDDMLFTISDSGTAMCLDAATGNEIWKERLKGNYAASLLYAGGRIYSFNREGRTVVYKAGREYKVIATNELEDGFMASAAYSDGALFLRTKTSLYRIQEE